MTAPEPWEAARDAFWEAERGGVARTGDGWDWATVQEGRRGWEAAVRAAVESSAAELRAVYRERARLVAFLAACYPAAIVLAADPAAPDWAVIFIGTPAGQLSWHLAGSDLDLFAHVERAAADDPTVPEWDGHSTEAKYERLQELAVHAADDLDLLAEMRERAEAAEAAKREARGELAALGDRIAAVIADAVKAERERAETAEAKIAEAREGIRNFLAQYGDSEIPMFKAGQDLANATLKILDGTREVPGA